jgi:hypothetical protein
VSRGGGKKRERVSTLGGRERGCEQSEGGPVAPRPPGSPPPLHLARLREEVDDLGLARPARRAGGQEVREAAAALTAERASQLQRASAGAQTLNQEVHCIREGADALAPRPASPRT